LYTPGIVLDLAPWPDADAILDAALALPSAHRRAFVEARTTDPGLRAALFRILDEATADDGFLDANSGDGAQLIAEWRQQADGDAPALTSGAILGAYRIIDSLGRGGMGEVYRAHDSTLGREVAIKVLPDDVMDDPARLARFRREARLLASLNHPHVGAIYTVVEDEQRLGLVLELVEGPTLAERLAQGPLPLRRALEIAQQIAAAIDAAHQQSIVHRDLKPANIKLSPGGVKVLDFGIAKALGEQAIDAGEPLSGQVPRAVMGTVAYMSPEQARGEPVDHRTDIWAFGCVLFEMLAGTRAFEGDSAVATLGRVLERDPDFSRLPTGTPAAIHRLLRRALDKNPRRRLASMSDALLDLEDGQASLERGRADDAYRGRRGLPLRWLAVAAVSVLALAVLWSFMEPGEPVPAVVELGVPIPPDQEVVVGQLPALAVSRDGRMLVYRVRQEGVMKLFARALGGREVVPIPGSEDVAGHALSPDGRSVVFAARGDVFRAAIGGTAAVRLGQLPGGGVLSWGTEQVIVASGGTSGALRRFPESGGEAVSFTTLDASRGHVSHGAPELLPDGRTVLFTVAAATSTHVGVTTIDGGEVTLLTEGRQPRLLPSGRLVFARDRALWMAGFDPSARRLTSEPVQVFDGVERSTLNAFVHFAVADDGTLFYIPWRRQAGLMRLAWHDRSGRELGLVREGAGLTRFNLSPHGRRVAIAVADGDERDIWVVDLERKTSLRLTSDPVPDSQPVWSPDGTHIAYRSDRDGGGVFLRRADAASEARRLTRATAGFHIPYAFTPDGTRVLFTDFRDYGDQDIRAVSLDTLAVDPVLAERFAEVHPAISPDGKWLAYQSDESGRFEVYIRPYPEVTRGRWQVSPNGGTSPAWRRDGREIVFAAGSVLTAVDFAGSGSPRLGPPHRLFTAVSSGERLGPQFDVSPDGQRVLLLSPAPTNPVADRPEVRVVQGWGAALERGSRR
jgi:eukaryotic-like serine/threonine-protein kinase